MSVSENGLAQNECRFTPLRKPLAKRARQKVRAAQLCGVVLATIPLSEGVEDARQLCFCLRASRSTAASVKSTSATTRANFSGTAPARTATRTAAPVTSCAEEKGKKKKKKEKKKGEKNYFEGLEEGQERDGGDEPARGRRRRRRRSRIGHALFAILLQKRQKRRLERNLAHGAGPLVERHQRSNLPKICGNQPLGIRAQEKQPNQLGGGPADNENRKMKVAAPGQQASSGRDHMGEHQRTLGAVSAASKKQHDENVT